MPDYYMQDPQTLDVFYTSYPEYHKQCTTLPKNRGKALYRQQTIEKLQTIIRPGDTIYTVLCHVSRSGMQREISLYTIQDNNPRYITVYVGIILDYKLGKRDGLVVNGCGMDIGFHTVYNLSMVLFSAGFGCIGPGCPANAHYNDDKDYTIHKENDPLAWHWHTDGGYALKQRWL